MTVAWFAFVGVGLLLGAWWFAGFRPVRPASRQHAQPPRTGDGAAMGVSVIVPARDEAATLPTLLASIAACGPVVAEVIVVDDASTDDTSAVAHASGARVVRLDGDPPAGWTGKTHGCARGAAVATAPLLLFLDADVSVAPDAVERLAAAHTAHGGLISVQPHHRVERPYESLSATCNVVAVVGTGAFAPWPGSVRAVAFGPCLLTSARDYAAVGGHAAVRGEVVEDARLAQRYAAYGLPVRCFAGADAFAFRMYPGGFRQLVDGWTKSLAPAAGLVSPLGVVVGVWWVAACAAVAVQGVTTLATARSVDRTEVIAAVAAWIAVAAELRWMLRQLGTFPRWVAVAHIVPTVAFLGLFLRSLWLTVVRREVRWRGRAVHVGNRAG